MLNALAAKNKLGFINGTISSPTPIDAQFSSWSGNNIMVLSWIQQTVDHGIKKTIMSSKLASEAWASLKARYGQDDMIRVDELIESISTLKQGNQTVTEYYDNLIALQDELDNYQAIDICRCTTTSHVDCAMMNVVVGYRDANSVIQFLHGLNDNYASVRSLVLFGDTLPPIDKVFHRALQHERQLYGTQQGKTITVESTTFTAQGSKGPFVSDKHPHCTFCNSLGHTEDTCYHKHGWPPGLSLLGSTMTSNPSAKPPECTFCKGIGHTEEKCFKKHDFPPSSQARPPPPRIRSFINATESGTSSDSQQEFKLTKSDYDKLMNLMNDNLKGKQSYPSHSTAPTTHYESAPSSNHSCYLLNHSTSATQWILDTGATDHIVSSLTFLHTFKNVNHIYINLPIGDRVQATHIGQVHCLNV
ncbi:unnamed protein product [Linum trigynum]|uniref:Retrotransposon gag domain-containing protein n=1 Tax=Linum trigynum TaxID=586398 RepID=A0AAV2EMU3_9ROSI